MAGSKYDWEAIEKDYRLGRYSNRQLAKKYGVSESGLRLKIKDKGWKKDLSKTVSQRVKEKVTTQAANSLAEDNGDGFKPSEEDIVEAAATTAANVVFEHRAYALKARVILGSLIARVEEQIESGKTTVVQFGNAMEVDIDNKEVSQTINAITQSLERIVKIERQSFRLDDDDKEENPATELTDEDLERQIAAALTSSKSTKS